MSTPSPVLKPNGYAARALAYIQANPGCTFTQIHNHLRPGGRTMSTTTRDTRLLENAGLIVKRRDNQCVRHYPTTTELTT